METYLPYLYNSAELVVGLIRERGSMNSSFGSSIVFMLPCTNCGVASSVSLVLVSDVVLMI